ncbi:DUF86 domain-containing protein [Patescibacteria group bacterium]|nr:DUF86 domain-containing protein [Patescibacteria group bacterium]MBU3999808.1 DUF86 domain-containing protein [Patescibacteria group bacterium]MBU4056810.1 DUF86 domain-containing protein [Patescibacteria group bacterium]MBU4368527.1 DUF86 domain-containing protein [Patescibacteria group bacterium]
MRDLKLDREIILERFDIIQKSLNRLEKLKLLSKGKFFLDDNFAIAEHYLRYALEAIFDICAHILARIPGVKADEYKEMALEMGKQRLVPKEFAKKNLYEMAGYRNRLTHFYFEIKPDEMRKIIQEDSGDFKIFMKHIKKIL